MIEQTLTWVVVADASKASVYSMHKAKIFQEQEQTRDFHLLETFQHAESRMKNTELVSDKMGEYGSSNFGQPTEPKVVEAEIFAHQLLAYLEKARNEHQFRDFILVAPPQFMGILNRIMSPGLAKLLSQRIEKDYTHLQDRPLLRALLNHL